MRREQIFANYCNDMIRELTELRSAAEKTMIDAGAIDFTEELEGNSFQWISLQHPQPPVLTYLPKIQDANSEPYQRMAGLLESLQGNLLPEALQLQGMTTLIRDNTVHFCISGSISVASLQTMCERHQEAPDPRQKK